MDSYALEKLVRSLPSEFLWRAEPPKRFLWLVENQGIDPRAKEDTRWAPKGTASQQFGGVSLFDFTQLPPDASNTLSKCEQFIAGYPETIWIGIKREGEIICSDRLYMETNCSTVHGSIRPVEVCMVGRIPLESFGPVYLLNRSDCALHDLGNAQEAARHLLTAGVQPAKYV